MNSTPSSAGTNTRITQALRQTASLSSALLMARSPTDLRRLAVSAGVVIGGGPSVILAYDPLLPHLIVDESEGVPRAKAQKFRFSFNESFTAELFERSAALENPIQLEEALKRDLGFLRPVVSPLVAGGRLRGIFAADARGDEEGDPSIGTVLLYALRQVGNVIAGAIAVVDQAGAEIQNVASDPVTGLADRNSAEGRVRHELARAKRYREPLSLVLFDVDSFDSLNENRGYQVGDRVLKEIAGLLVGGSGASGDLALCFRESDLAARWGSDSFLVVLPSTSQSGAQLAGERFLSGLRERQWDVGSSLARVTATASVVTFPDDGADEKELLGLAERLVADASHGGGDRLVLAAPSEIRTKPRI